MFEGITSYFTGTPAPAEPATPVKKSVPQIAQTPEVSPSGKTEASPAPVQGGKSRHRKTKQRKSKKTRKARKTKRRS